jgi:hypothetical protein
MSRRDRVGDLWFVGGLLKAKRHACSADFRSLASPDVLCRGTDAIFDIPSSNLRSGQGGSLSPQPATVSRPDST